MLDDDCVWLLGEGVTIYRHRKECQTDKMNTIYSILE